jgi:tetratricopeptide (TPR) repeat protein
MTPTDPTTNITGDVDGNVLLGNFSGSVQTGDGQQVPIDNKAPNQGAQGVFNNSPVTINNNVAPTLTPPPAFQVPYQAVPLVGRSEDLTRLIEFLLADAPVVQTSALSGMGGVGKTMLAATFARQHQADFPDGVFWLNMEQPELIAAQVAACAGPGGLDLIAYDQLSFEERIAQVKIAWNSSERRLLVFDNLEDPALLKQWQPTGTGSRVLITTRRDDWPRQVRRMRLAGLSRLQSIDLLLGARAAEQERTVASMLADHTTAAEADVICALLGDLPLALAIAAAFLHISPSTSLKRYHAQIETDPLAREREADPTIREILAEAGLPTGHERRIIATFAMSYQQLDAAHATDALALKMLHAAAYCAPAPIPQEVLWWVGEVAGNQADAIEQRDLAIRRLRATGLLAFDTEQVKSAPDTHNTPQPVLLHRLIANYVYAQHGDENILDQLCTALITVGDAIVNRSIAQQGSLLIPHLEHVVSQPRLKDERVMAALINALANLYDQQANYADALPLYKRALAIRENILGSNDPHTAISLGNLAGSYQATGHYAEALRLYEKSLSMNVEVHGPMHLDTALSLSNLGVLYRVTGAYQKALPLLRQALSIRKQILGSHDLLTARSLNDLATVLELMGEYDPALVLFQEALEIAERAGRDPMIGGFLNNLAGCYRSMGQYRNALPLFQQSLVQTEQSFGPNHPDTLTCLSNLAGVYQQIEAYTEALTIYTQILPIREQVLGSDHPDTSTTLNDLAYLYSATGAYAKAIPLYERAVDIGQRMLGANHPTTATCINNLAICYAKQGDFVRATQLAKQALKIRERALGLHHPLTTEAQQSLLEMQRVASDTTPSTLGRVVKWLRRNQG